MMMHAMGEEATLILGHVGAICAILGGYFHLHMRVTKLMLAADTKLTKLSIEHEILVDFVCKAQGINRDDLPTRHERVSERL